MRGHTRKRGSSWEFNVDVGMAAAQRCEACNKRTWIERKPLKECPKCGAQLHETEERRRAIKGGFATQKEAQAAMNRVITAVEESRFVAPSTLSLREYLLKEWLPAIRATVRPATFASYTMLAEQHIVPTLGTTKLQRLTPAAINALYGRLLESGRVKGEGGLSVSSVRRVHAVLHRALRDAVRWGYLQASPAAGADPPKQSGNHTERAVWDRQQLLAFLDSLADDRLFALWRLLAMTGCRRGEALGLRWEDLDIEAGTITIRRSLGVIDGEILLSDPKTKRGMRTIALDPLTLEALKAHAARQADERQEWDDAWVDSGYIFTRENGSSLHPYAVSAMFRRHSRAAALPEIPLHSLRHSYATLAISSGVNPRIVSARLGHATVALTLDIYSHVLPQADADAASQIAALLEG